MKRTSKKDFETFKREFTRWQERLGLTEWRVRFHHERIDESMAAYIRADLEGRLVSVFLGFRIDHTIEEVARHEALELLVADMDNLASYRFVRHDEIEMARHSVIRRLERLLDELKPNGVE